MASGDTELTFVLEKATEGITKIKEQRDLSTKHEGLEARPAVFGVVKATRDNDIELHSNQQVCSCQLILISYIYNQGLKNLRTVGRQSNSCYATPLN